MVFLKCSRNLVRFPRIAMARTWIPKDSHAGILTASSHCVNHDFHKENKGFCSLHGFVESSDDPWNADGKSGILMGFDGFGLESNRVS